MIYVKKCIVYSYISQPNLFLKLRKIQPYCNYDITKEIFYIILINVI